MDALKKQSRIKAVHAACRAQGIDEDTRRAIQIQVTGKASLKDMSALDLTDLLNHLNRRKGDKDGNEWRFTFKLAADRRTYCTKIYRLAQRIGALQSPPVPVMSKAYIEGVAAQMRGCDQPLEFCDTEQLHKIVQALEIYLKRHGG
jgi:phage gp16-like protein